MLKLYNTLSGKKEVFKPRQGKRVKLFVCGPTTYDFSHIGHARTYIVFDAIAKYLRQKGYDVFYLQNITDIDDKIIARAKEKRLPWNDLSRNFEKEHKLDMVSLKIDGIKYVKATDCIEEIKGQIKRLLDKGYAYQIEDGIYYDISKFKGYGKLSRRTVLRAEDAVSRIDDSVRKKNKGDFCLWKFSKPGEPKWKAPFGEGRPGWHIEDTAITEKYFGPQYDIHGGARDLIFPHHEAEIAQMEAISGKKPLAKYWLHTGFLTVKNRKMAKSLGNFITIQDFLKNYSGRILRLFVLKTHYRSPINYSEKMLSQTKQELERIDEFIDKIRNPKFEIRNKSQITISKYKKGFDRAMEDDFNTPKAVASLFDLINKGNALIAKNKLSPADAKNILEFLKKTDETFGFIFWKKPKEKTPQEIIALVKEREKYRKERNWLKADEVRQKIQKMGWRIEDTSWGPKVKKL